MDQARIRPVILSGGAGTRLWPLSRPDRPKQFHALAGPTTMLQATAARVGDRALFHPLWIVAGAAHAEAIEAQLAQAGARAEALILEPAPRNTAAAVALAALAAPADDLLLILPSDHFIADEAAFLAAVRIGREGAARGRIVTFGVRPERPETGYGYIRRGAAIGGGLFDAAEFVEKPDRATAGRYLADGGYDWNAGIFLFRAGDMADALAAHAPDILEPVRAALAGGRRSDSRIEPDPARFAAAPARSIDLAVMEHAGNVAVVPVRMGWSDLGSWDALHALGPRDGAGNLLSGPVTSAGVRDCLIRSDGPRIVIAGVSGLIVVATADGVLILPRGESQRIKDLLDQPPESPGD